MNEMRALIVSEAKLLFREPIYWLVVILLPTAILVIFGSIFGPSEPDPALGGLRFIDVFVPSLVVISVATLGIQTLPIRLATYREKGVLRRLSTTPAHPLRLLVAQFVVYAVDGGRLPRAPGRRRERRVRRAVAAGPARVRRRVRARDELPVRDRPAPGGRRTVVQGGDRRGHPAVLRGDAARRRLPAAGLPARHPGPHRRVHAAGRAGPPGRVAGNAPQLLPLAVLAAITVVGGLVASRVFRWE